MKNKKTEKPIKEKSPSPQPPPEVSKNVVLMETEAQDPEENRRK